MFWFICLLFLHLGAIFLAFLTGSRETVNSHLSSLVGLERQVLKFYSILHIKFLAHIHTKIHTHIQMLTSRHSILEGAGAWYINKEEYRSLFKEDPKWELFQSFVFPLSSLYAPPFNHMTFIWTHKVHSSPRWPFVSQPGRRGHAGQREAGGGPRLAFYFRDTKAPYG